MGKRTDNESNENLEQRVQELEQTVKKMLPGRRSVLAGGAAAGAALLGASGSASADGLNDGDTQWGSDTNRDDYVVDHVDANSVDTEEADITERWNFETGYNIPTKRITDNSNYNNEPHIFRISDGELIVIYRTNGSHNTTDSHKLVARKSSDNGESWGDEITVADPTEGTGNPNAFYVEDEDKIVVQYRSLGSSGDNNTYELVSTDGGESWSNRTQITAFGVDPAIPFGQAIETSNGWMLLAYSDGAVEAAFSDDGESWGSVTTVVDSSGDANHKFYRAVRVAR